MQQAWVTDDGEVSIEQDAQCGCGYEGSVQANEIAAIASISDDYMGLISAAGEEDDDPAM